MSTKDECEPMEHRYKLTRGDLRFVGDVEEVFVPDETANEQYMPPGVRREYRHGPSAGVFILGTLTCDVCGLTVETSMRGDPRLEATRVRRTNSPASVMMARDLARMRASGD